MALFIHGRSIQEWHSTHHQSKALQATLPSQNSTNSFCCMCRPANYATPSIFTNGSQTGGFHPTSLRSSALCPFKGQGGGSQRCDTQDHTAVGTEERCLIYLQVVQPSKGYGEPYRSLFRTPQASNELKIVIRNHFQFSIANFNDRILRFSSHIGFSS